MVLLRPQTVAAMTQPKPAARPDKSIVGVQLVTKGGVSWARKAAWLRCPPYTVGPWAHAGQLEVRIAFAEAAARARGKTGLVMTDIGPLPPAAAEVHNTLRGFRAPDAMRPEEYPSKMQTTAYRAGKLRLFLERKLRGRAPARAPPAPPAPPAGRPPTYE